jgi:hypothetical protein
MSIYGNVKVFAEKIFKCRFKKAEIEPRPAGPLRQPRRIEASKQGVFVFFAACCIIMMLTN